MSDRPHVAVIGGGLAGIAAGRELQGLGARVELFERSRLLGGRATSFEIDGIEVDNGQHVFLGCCTEFLDLARAAGFAEHLYLQPRFEALVLERGGAVGWLRAAPLPAPLHLLASFAGFAHLPAMAKLRVARAILAAATERPDAATTFEAWLVLHGQDAVTRRAFWDPFFIPALNAPFDRVAVGDALFTLRTAFLADAGGARFGYATRPLAHLAAAAAAPLDAVHLQSAVVSVEPDADGVELVFAQGRRARFDALAIATSPRAAAKLLGDPARYGVAQLAQYAAFPILDVHLWHDAGRLPFDFAATIASPLQWIFQKAPGYLSCSFSAAGDAMSRATADLEAFAWSEVQAYVPALRSAARVRSAVTRNPEATWLPAIGAARTAQQTALPHLAMAGSWTQTGWPDTMESAVRAGRAAARYLSNARRDARG